MNECMWYVTLDNKVDLSYVHPVLFSLMPTSA